MGAGKEESRKDVADLLEQERKELEGDKPLIDQSNHHTLILQIEKADDSQIIASRKAMVNL